MEAFITAFGWTFGVIFTFVAGLLLLILVPCILFLGGAFLVDLWETFRRGTKK